MKHVTLDENDWIAAEREISSRSLTEYLKLSWPVIEPINKYLHGWHMDAMGEHLAACAEGDITRLLINVPPGTSKSTETGVTFPSWLWGPGGKPGSRFISASHEAGLATRDNRKTRNLIESDWFQRRWPMELVHDQNEKTSFENKFGGFRQASAVKSMTGKRGDFVLWDDPHSPEKAYSPLERETAIRVFKETLPLRVVNPEKSVIIIVKQRLHEEDISGHILSNDYGYVHLCLPMEFEEARRCYTVIKPSYMKSKRLKARYDKKEKVFVPLGTEVDEKQIERLADVEVQRVYNVDPRTKEGELLLEKRFPRSVVERDKKVMGAFATAGQFQQRPTPREGGLFQKRWFNIIPAAPAGTRWVRAWDLAGTEASNAAFTAGVLMGKAPDESIIVGDATRGQLQGAAVERLLKNTASQDEALYGVVFGSLPQDPGSAGKSWAQHLLKVLMGYNYHFSPESGDKVTRAMGFSAQAEAGNVYLVKGDWNEAYLDELGSFPSGKWKDQVDASSRAFSELLNGSNYSLEGSL